MPIMLAIALALAACSPDPVAATDSADTGVAGWWADPDAVDDPFADAVVSFAPGEGAGFGQSDLPGVVLGPPRGTFAGTPSLDVVSLGSGGVIVLELVDITLIDGPGADLLVFENAMPAWTETATVGVSVDGIEFVDWPCAADDVENGSPGCAGTQIVFGGPGAADPTDPATAGGDAFDLGEIGVSNARYVRVVDSGVNSYTGATGGFDLDAIAVVNGAP